jgi:hypothetical protein
MGVFSLRAAVVLVVRNLMMLLKMRCSSKLGGVVRCDAAKIKNQNDGYELLSCLSLLLYILRTRPATYLS